MMSFVMNVAVAYLVFGFLFTTIITISQLMRKELNSVYIPRAIYKFILITICWLPFLIIEADIF